MLKRSIEDREIQRHSVGNPGSILDSLTNSGFSTDEIDQIRRQIIVALDGAYNLLEPVGFAYGYRISKEVFVYLNVWIETKIATGSDKTQILASWPEGLDKAFLQKVLPKIHGNRRVIGDSLRALSAFLAGNDSSSTPAASYTLGVSTKVEIPPGAHLNMPGSGGQFVLSRRKLDSMHDRLNAIGYVSFVG